MTAAPDRHAIPGDVYLTASHAVAALIGRALPSIARQEPIDAGDLAARLLETVYPRIASVVRRETAEQIARLIFEDEQRCNREIWQSNLSQLSPQMAHMNGRALGLQRGVDIADEVARGFAENGGNE